MKPRLPKFLVVGAMKAATTTLFEDLATHPQIFAPIEKEPGYLCSDDVFCEELDSCYGPLFEGARPYQLCFEASTYYTMRPDNEGVAERAKKLVGPNLKVIYLVREPVARSVSHHAHAHARGDCDSDVNKAIYSMPRLIGYSKYFYQIEPWLQVFGEDNVFILTQEYYVRHRRDSIEAIETFLGLDPSVDRINTEWVGNPRSTLVEDTSLTRILRSSKLYQRGIRRFLSPSMRSSWKRVFMRRIARPVSMLSEETRKFIIDETSEDIGRLAPFVRLKEPGGWV